MMIKDFMDILAWQKAQVLVVQLYARLETMSDKFLKEQILNSASEALNAIAAGYERRSEGLFREYLYVAKTKTAEVRALLSVAKDTNQIDGSAYENFNTQAEDVSKLLFGFIRTFIDKKKKTTDQ